MVDVADDGGGVGFGFDGLEVVVVAAKLDARPQFVQDFVEAAGVRPVSPPDEGFDIGDAGDDDVDVHAERKPEVFLDLAVERVDQGEGDGRAVHPDGQGSMLARKVGGDEGQDFVRRLKLAQVDVFGAEVVRQGLVKLVFGDDAEVDQNLKDAFAGAEDFCRDVIDLAAVDDLLIHEDFEDLVCVHSDVFLCLRTASCAASSRS